MAVIGYTSHAHLGRYTTLAAEYYQPEYVAAEQRLSILKKYCSPLRVCCNQKYPITYGVLKPREVHTSQCRLARIQNSEALFVFGDDLPSISPDQFEEYARSEVRVGDILLAIGGYIGPLGIIADSGGCRLNINRHLARISPNPEAVDGYYLAAYLATPISQTLLVREIRGAVQAGINIADLKVHPVFLPPSNVQREVGDLMRLAEGLLAASRDSYSDAQQVLGSELGLDKPAFRTQADQRSSFSIIGQSAAYSAGRIDAQCFGSDALLYEHWLRKRARCEPLGGLLRVSAKGRQQRERRDGAEDYCSIKHIVSRELVGASKCAPAADTPFAKRNDLLLAITGATIGKVGLVKRYEQLAFSGDLLCLRTVDAIDPHYLLGALDHRLGQVQFNRWITGSTNGHLAPRDVARVLVPRLDATVEQGLATLVEASLSKRREAEQLVNKAKERVEQLIMEAIK